MVYLKLWNQWTPRVGRGIKTLYSVLQLFRKRPIRSYTKLSRVVINIVISMGVDFRGISLSVFTFLNCFFFFNF